MQDCAATHLNNGLRLVMAELPHLHSATVSLAVACGSRHEASNQWGLAHLLEHMLFRGSARYPSAHRLALAFEQAGATLEAETWRDHTYLSVTAHPTRLTAVLTALADMVIAPCFKDLHIERQIVETELQAELDEHGRDIDLGNLSRAHVWPRSAMGRRVIGCRSSLRRFEIADLANLHRALYGAQNAVLAVAGPIKMQAVHRLVKSCFASMPCGQVAPATQPAHFAPRNHLNVRRRAGSQAALQLTFDALPDEHPDFLAQTLLVNILDDGLTSRLQQALCARRGLVYTLTTGLDCYNDCGLYDIEMHVAPRRATTALAATLETLEDLRDGGVGAAELARAQHRSVHALEFRMDSPAELAQHLAIGALFHPNACQADEVTRLLRVTPQDILRVARKLFGDCTPHVTLMGPTQRVNLTRLDKNLSAFETIRRGGRIARPAALKAASAQEPRCRKPQNIVLLAQEQAYNL